MGDLVVPTFRLHKKQSHLFFLFFLFSPIKKKHVQTQGKKVFFTAF
jgi:hypothetical protein